MKLNAGEIGVLKQSISDLRKFLPDDAVEGMTILAGTLAAVAISLGMNVDLAAGLVRELYRELKKDGGRRGLDDDAAS